MSKLKTQLTRFMQLRDDRKLDLAQYTHARVGLGHTGGHWRTQDWLAFQEGFALAKEAVFSAYPMQEMRQLCKTLNLPWMEIQSNAETLESFLLRPDNGRQLSEEDKIKLAGWGDPPAQPDVLLVISGGLSPIAITQQMPTFLPLILDRFHRAHWTLAPVMLNRRGRIALGDQINQYFKAKLTVVLVGERPGLSTADSLGIYFTYAAKPGCTDGQRNCISNIHQYGLSHRSAVDKLMYLLTKATTQKISGVQLKDDFIITS